MRNGHPSLNWCDGKSTAGLDFGTMLAIASDFNALGIIHTELNLSQIPLVPVLIDATEKSQVSVLPNSVVCDLHIVNIIDRRQACWV